MEPEKTTAIVLRVVDFSETSCVVTMMTRSHGKITALAKGARRPKGPFEAALDVLAICNIVFIHKTSGAMDLLTEAKLERRFKSGAKNLDRLYVGYYVAELLRILTDDADAHPDVFDLAINMIEQIEQTDDPSKTSLSQLLIEFELGLLDALGHLPMLTKCVSCGRDKTTIDRVRFGLNDGGVICAGCRPGKANIVELSRDAFAALLKLAGSDFASQIELSEQSSLKPQNDLNPGQLSEQDSSSIVLVEPILDSKTEQICAPEELPADLTNVNGFEEVRQLIRKYVTHLVGFPPRLHAYLKNL